MPGRKVLTRRGWLWEYRVDVVSPVESRKRLKGFSFFERDSQRALAGNDDAVHTGTIASGGCGWSLASIDRIDGNGQQS